MNEPDLISDDIVKSAAVIIQTGLESFSAEIISKTEIITSFANILGISLPESANEGHEKGNKITIAYVGGFFLLNALIFHERLAAFQKHILPISQLERGSIINSLQKSWETILKEIGYYPIFHIAKELLLVLSKEVYSLQAFETLIETAKKVIEIQGVLKYDLAGRFYHKLLTNAKYLGTFYTSVPAATLLLKLTLSRKEFPINWLNLDDIGKLRIADLACGTGTLLVAAINTIIDNHIKASTEIKTPPKVKELQKILIEKTIWGFDILPSAIRFAASILAMNSPEMPINNINLFCLPFGSDFLGSIDFLKRQSLFENAIPAKQMSAYCEKTVKVSLPELDFCIMNPPFVRSTGGNLLFGWLSQAERIKLQNNLRKIAKEYGNVNIQAGLGAIFVRVAHEYMKPGSRMALILPKAVLSGVAWSETRKLISSSYTLNYVIQSFDPKQWNFSENTGLSETLLIATKGYKSNAKTTFVNLWKNPNSTPEASVIAEMLEEKEISDLMSEKETYLDINGQIIGTVYNVSWETVKKSSNWLFYCPFAQTFLTKLFLKLLESKFELFGCKTTIPMISFEKIGEIGSDVRQLVENFEITDIETQYLAFWNHNADEVFTIAQTPNKYLSLKRNKRDNIWANKGKLLLASSFNSSSQRLASVLVDKEVLSNSWWVIKTSEKNAKILSLWFNSTLGFLMFLGYRVETVGPWMHFKKSILKKMPVLNPEALVPEQEKILLEAYEELCSKTLLPFSKLTEDPVRRRIDEAIESAFQITILSQVRELLSKEPIISNRPLTETS